MKSKPNAPAARPKHVSAQLSTSRHPSPRSTCFKGHPATTRLSAFSNIANLGMASSNDWMRRATEKPEDRTEEQFREQVAAYIDVLKERVRDDDCRDLIVGQIAPAFGVQVTNESDDFIEHLTVEVHIEGPIEALDFAPGTTAKYDYPVPRAPRPVGTPQDRIRRLFDGAGTFDQRAFHAVAPGGAYCLGPHHRLRYHDP